MNKTSKGTYVAVELSDASSEQLYTFVTSQGISNPLKSSSYHTTVLYSRIRIEVDEYSIPLPVTAIPTGWELFSSDSGDNVLVLTVSSPELDQHHTAFRAMGATHDYPDYRPHVTVSYKFEGEVPSVLPAFSLEFDFVTKKELELTFTY